MKNVLYDKCSACSYLKNPYFTFYFWRIFFLKILSIQPLPLHSEGGDAVIRRIGRRAGGDGSVDGHNTLPNPQEGDFFSPAPVLRRTPVPARGRIVC